MRVKALLGQVFGFADHIQIQLHDGIAHADMGFKDALDVAFHLGFAVLSGEFLARRDHSALAVDYRYLIRIHAGNAG